MCWLLKKQAMLTILGPTATGKTKLAVHLASKLNGEVISADSRQVYKEMNIGTGKDYNDYIAGTEKIPVHLIDIVEPGSQYNCYQYQQDFLSAYKDVTERNKLPVLCGGTGLYIEAVLSGYSFNGQGMPSLQGMASLHGFPKIKTQIFGIHYDREIIRQRITKRLKERLENGMIEEVKKLLEKGISPAKLKSYGLEYKFITLYILGEIKKDEMIQKLNTAIHRFAKRQMTWFRKMQRDGFQINWIDGELPLEKKIEKICEIYNV